VKSARAKLFQNGGSQAVRLPKACRFPRGQREVVVRLEGRKVILEPLEDWSDAFRSCLGAWPSVLPRPKGGALRDPFA